MIEVRFPTPDKKKLKLLNQYAEQEFIESIDWGNFVYAELPKYKLAKFKRYVTENCIAGAEQIEEIQSIDLPINPPEDIILLIKFLKESRIDFSIIPFVKLPIKDYDALMRFCNENNIWDEPP